MADQDKPVSIPGAAPWTGDDDAAPAPAKKMGPGVPGTDLGDGRFIGSDGYPRIREYQPDPLPEGALKRDYDWVAIKRMYIEGVKNPDGDQVTRWPTLDEVAATHNVRPGTVRDKSAAEGWVGERQKWQAQIESTRRQARAGALARAGTNIENRALTAAQNGLALCLAKLEEIGAQVQARRAATVGDGVALTGLDTREQLLLAQAVDLWHKIGLRALGDPELSRIEITGPNGRPIEIAQELKRDDPQRISTVLAVLQSAGLGELFGADDSAGAATVRGRVVGDGSSGVAE